MLAIQAQLKAWVINKNALEFISALLLVIACGSMSEVKSSQQPAEEARPLGSKETDEEVYHRGDKDDTCRHVV